jgi:Fe-S-cluster-containing dehydrogenase component
MAASQMPVKKAMAGPKQPLATLLDIGKCVACGACVEACRETNAHKYPAPQKPYPAMYPKRVRVEDWSDKQDVDDRLTPYNWLHIQTAEVEVDGEITEINIPRRCMHCSNPPCVKLCPFGAARQFDNGISRIDSDLCLGGAKCRTVCPWKIPQRQTGVGLYLDLMPNFAGNGVMYKCDRCYDRVAAGELPACIDACPEEVQTIGPRDQIMAQAQKLAEEMDGYIYGATENGGTNTIYVSPVPFEDLNAAIDKGKGQPHLGPAEDAMSVGDNLARAMVLAPLAGIAAAAGRFYKATKI